MKPWLVLLLLVALTAGAALPGRGGYSASLSRWRGSHEAELKAEGGWLSVAGLFWLRAGANSFGSGAVNDIVLPPVAPVRAGVFELTGGKVRVRLEKGVAGTVDGKSASEGWLVPDHPGPASVLRIARLTLLVIERGGRLGIRLKDPDAPARRNFRGLEWFAADPAFRVRARFLPYPQPKTLEVDAAAGGAQRFTSPGVVEFTLRGEQLRLEPVLEGPGATHLFFIFRDLTAGKGTYPAGRFLYADMPAGGSVVLDFNRAENPPCAFTPYATCPLPPPQNRLKVAIPAGEKYRGGH